MIHDFGSSSIWKEFEETKRKLLKAVNGKQILLWGYEYTGWFTEHLLRMGGRSVDRLFDDHIKSNKIDCDPSLMLAEIDPDDTIILLTFAPKAEVDERLRKFGFNENNNYFWVKKLFFFGDTDCSLNYYTWLEEKYDVVFNGIKSVDVLEKPSNDAREYSSNIEYSFVDIFNQFIIDEDDALYDFGCGKCGVNVLADYVGFKKSGGVEYDQELYKIGIDNLKTLGLPCDGISCGDAREIKTELDDYNYFYFYNPFVGDTFMDVIHNIEESYERKKRKITLIYRNTRCSVRMGKESKFKLTRQIYTDSWIKRVNVYMLGE